MQAYTQRLDALKTLVRKLEDRKAETDTKAFFLSRSHVLVDALGSPSQCDERHNFLTVLRRMMSGRERSVGGGINKPEKAAAEECAESPDAVT
jgi:hypothetical protein